MTRWRKWFCRHRPRLLRWSVLLAALSPVAAWTIGKAFAVDAGAVLIMIAALLFAVWRPYRDSWLRAGCARQGACA